ncbi:tRNA uridine-5-carboxymethylaminomethyl(34) synthesis GTPase MnmE [Bartonella tamiae]|uniref:tRNA modification GTPase MnmE n=1 Tax=Bartonella tamiae Th239 TaxID=1094558 RepID=J0ZQQ2_9HYPH|nr:tRNA uridine-5-carboxymethylaminomethyl(34) synthesis GTPase MnmE [Bartonella tamiae]EJF90978.1 tRNA modification GTPase TrmE [Bartonella tamiae Th239]EJF93357.1 tRNA modification GTPase TrmE [Bartonella tamiae Th307]
MDTIFAVSSGLLPSGVAVIRISGERVREIIQTLYGKIPEPRIMSYGSLIAKDGTFLDTALTVFFQEPKSFTGEDCVEFHIHGGKAVAARLLEELSQFDNCRIAEPGEFSRRAFFNGKLDLTQAEGLADLIEAETESQRRLALMGTSGKLATLYREWRDKLIKARALIEAEFDFADEGDIPGSVSDQVWEQLPFLRNDIQKHLDQEERANLMRDGLKVVIAGAPNAGKSSLINKLTGRDLAIVTDIAGTTRDALETRLILGGLPILLSDTAGLHETDNPIEKLGIDTAYDRIKEADLILLVEDMNQPHYIDLPQTKAVIWRIGNKQDVIKGDNQRWPIQISAIDGEGVDHLLRSISDFCSNIMAKIGDALPARKRQSDLLFQTLKEIDNALLNPDLDLTLRAEHLRLASDALGRITGDIDVEDILDVIFSEFCIGK